MIKTFYIDNPSGSVAILLLIEKWIRVQKDFPATMGMSNGVHWISTTAEGVERMIDWVAQHTHSIVEVLNEDAKIVASTHPVEPERGDPHSYGPYLCLVSYQADLGLYREWKILDWHNDAEVGDCWKNAHGSVKRWLHLPRHF